MAWGIMFGPWAAYFPVSLCQGCDIITLCHLQQHAMREYGDGDGDAAQRQHLSESERRAA